MRIAVVDIGTNSTRLLIADVGGRQITELARRSTITRLGQGVDGGGKIVPSAAERVFAVIENYESDIENLGVTEIQAVATSAVREAKNGREFLGELSDRYQVEVETISGEKEAALTYSGAMHGLSESAAKSVVIDVGGGSTELAVGSGEQLEFSASTELGCVRQGERYLKGDPPTADELDALNREAKSILEAAVKPNLLTEVKRAIAVAGTPTSLAAIDQELEPYDSEAVHGYRLKTRRCREILELLCSKTLGERQKIVGLHPERAISAIPGTVILLQALDLFRLDEVTVSEHDLLYGLALRN